MPSQTIKSVVSQILSTGEAQHAYLGVKLDSTASNARLASVVDGTPAADAGLRAGDVITGIAGQRVTTGVELQAAIAGQAAGRRGHADLHSRRLEPHGHRHADEQTDAPRVAPRYRPGP